MMSVERDHPWNLTPAEGIYLQKELSQQLDGTVMNNEVEFVGGADVSYLRDYNQAFAVIFIYRITQRNGIDCQLTLEEYRTYQMEIKYPYIPGLLVFREGPALEKAWYRLKQKPDLLIFDGAGVAHPRRCGLAVHLGWRWNVPAIGCAKSRLIGKSEEPGKEKGEVEPLYDKHTKIGDVVRTRSNVKPLYVSPGYQTNFKQSVFWTLKTVKKYRLPEPVRHADKWTKQLSQTFKKERGLGCRCYEK